MKTRIVLLYARGLDFPEIAAELGSSTGAVKNHMWRARIALQAKHNGRLVAMVMLAQMKRAKAAKPAK